MFYHKAFTVDPFKPKSADFGVWSARQIRKLSVAKVTTYISFDNLGHPVAGGLYDARFGPLKFDNDPCATCGQNSMRCSGHYGHIELPFPVLNPLFTPVLSNILKITCFNCYRLIITPNEKLVLTAQLRLTDSGHLNEARQLDTYLNQNGHKLPHQIENDMEEFVGAAKGNRCKNVDELWKYYTKKIFHRSTAKACPLCTKLRIKVSVSNRKLYKSEITEKGIEKTNLTPLDAMQLLRKVWQNDRETLVVLIKAFSSSDEEYPTDLCFVSAVLVTPSNTRPVHMVRGRPIEHFKSIVYRHIIQDCIQIRSVLQVMNDEQPLSQQVKELVESLQGSTINEKLNNSWHSLQVRLLLKYSSLSTKTLMKFLRIFRVLMIPLAKWSIKIGLRAENDLPVFK